MQSKPEESHRLEESKAEEEKNKPLLDPNEEKKAKEEESLDQKITYDVIRREGDKELERPASALLWGAMAGGLSMGFSFLVEGLLRSHLPDAEWRPLITKLGYPVGFLIITLGSQQLFTENTLTPVVPLLVARTGEIFRRLCILWIVVLLGNLIGTFVFASLVGLTDALDPKVHIAFSEIGKEAVRNDFLTTFTRAIFAGWLIALMVWMLPAASTQQIGTVAVMTYIVGIGGFAHVIVGSVEVFYLVVTGQAPVSTFLAFFLPTLLGNVLGGLILVTALNHEQVTAGNGHRK